MGKVYVSLYALKLSGLCWCVYQALQWDHQECPNEGQMCWWCFAPWWWDWRVVLTHNWLSGAVCKERCGEELCKVSVPSELCGVCGLKLAKSGVVPSKSMLSVIEGFPTPRNITDVRSWLGLVNKVAWAYSLGPVMQPFRDLLCRSSKFYWDEQLNEAFWEV